MKSGFKIIDRVIYLDGMAVGRIHAHVAESPILLSRIETALQTGRQHKID